ncbi:YhjD/YihY/BrkB family envelope integrity protein [Ramlibacter alkalitolerans]|uniref:YihY family inner membrane protein n=1 Tax=Ramlibacter alkalitolerans TaxID=2039631 RepID=A0ABS1JI94_9BURK|nr:YhjD/YihY/BrkB family envelope integrity protein [Ramlibacter alkalitolerans]MBL0423525.1 YihY family inner membrane protein [Ramlibacter alkalitolerans]
MSGFVGVVLRRGREERLAQGAGGLTFTTLLSLVPLLVVSFALFTRIPALRTAGETVREHLLRGLLPPEIARTVARYLARFAFNAGGLTLAGSLFLVVSALALVLSVENALNRIWQVKKPRPIPHRLALCAALLLAGPVALGASLWATSLLLAATGPLVATSPPWMRHAIEAAPVVLGAVSFACLFRFVPHAPVRRRDAIAGGLLAALAFELGKRGFAMYLAHVPTYRTVYGAFAPLLAFLVWVYYSWWVTLAAALVSASLSPGGKSRARRLAG